MKLSDENPADELTAQDFSRHGRHDWELSLKRLARAQAILWHQASMGERQKVLARVDEEWKERKA